MFCLAQITIISVIFQDWLVSWKDIVYKPAAPLLKAHYHFHQHIPHNEITNLQTDIRHKVIHTKYWMTNH